MAHQFYDLKGLLRTCYCIGDMDCGQDMCMRCFTNRKIDYSKTLGLKLNLDKNKEESKMKPEDLKVGMIFKERNNYRKIIKITKKSVFYLYINTADLSVGCNDWPIKDFLGIDERVDRVPSETMGSEEEVPLYIDNRDLKNILEKNYCLDTRLVTQEEKGLLNDPTELCKIKRKVTKELNFNWETMEWE